MDLNSLVLGLLSAGSAGRNTRHRDGRSPSQRPPAYLAGLSDHQLRDLGYVRERGVSHRHLMWM